MSKFSEANKKIEKAVVSGYKAIEDTVVGGYKKIEDKFVDTFLTANGSEKESDTQEEVEKDSNE